LPAFWARLSGRGLAIGTGPHLGTYQGGVALVRVAAGLAGDRWRRHKEVAVAGYGLSAACRLALLTAGTALSTIGAIVLADRTGKGIRTAPRDAMISRSTPSDQLGTAFGVHRAMDTTRRADRPAAGDRDPRCRAAGVPLPVPGHRLPRRRRADGARVLRGATRSSPPPRR
jgi:hypothetical protein